VLPFSLGVAPCLLTRWSLVDCFCPMFSSCPYFRGVSLFIVLVQGFLLVLVLEGCLPIRCFCQRFFPCPCFKGLSLYSLFLPKVFSFSPGMNLLVFVQGYLLVISLFLSNVFFLSCLSKSNCQRESARTLRCINQHYSVFKSTSLLKDNQIIKGINKPNPGILLIVLF
jgi:hypothetical protein